MRFLDETARRERRRRRFAHWRVAVLLACTFVLSNGPSIHSRTAAALGPELGQSRVAAFARPELEIVVAAIESELDLRRLAFASAEAFEGSRMSSLPVTLAAATANGG
jgi:hypothetical protein